MTISELKFRHLYTDSGATAANQIIIDDQNNKKIYFKSYKSMIAIYDESARTMTIGSHYNYSATTLRYLKQFMSVSSRLMTQLSQLNGKSWPDTLKRGIAAGILIYDANLQ